MKKLLSDRLMFFAAFSFIVFTTLAASAMLSPPSINFGQTRCNFGGSSRSLVFYNNTGEDLRNVSASITGIGFSGSSSCFSVPANSSCNIQVSFRPARPGYYYGTVQVRTNRSIESASLSGSCQN